MVSEIKTISRFSANYYLAYADFPTTDIRTGELAYATDRLVLYRWSGTAWQSISIHSSSGTAAAKPAAATLPNGSLYYETDTSDLYQVQAGAWVKISPPNIGEGHIVILPFNYESIGQGTWTAVNNAGFLYVEFYNTSVNLDNVSYKVYLAAGTYTLAIQMTTHSNAGILDIDIDTTEVGNIDCYVAVPVGNQNKKVTGIVVATPGLKTLKLRVDGKNVASTGYQVFLNVITLWRTA